MSLARRSRNAMRPHAPSRELRRHDSPWLRRRRGIVGLSLLAAGCMQLIGLYQMGLIKRLPEPPLPGLDAETVNASDEAYCYLATPDAFLGLGSYAVTAILAAMGSGRRVQCQPWVPALMGAKVLVDAVQAGRLTWQQWAQYRVFCFWCVIAAAATFVSVPLAMPEASAAVQRLWDRWRAR